jgi:hypothetical protein
VNRGGINRHPCPVLGSQNAQCPGRPGRGVVACVVARAWLQRPEERDEVRLVLRRQLHREPAVVCDQSEKDLVALVAATDLNVSLTAELKSNNASDGGLTLGAQEPFTS